MTEPTEWVTVPREPTLEMMVAALLLAGPPNDPAAIYLAAQAVQQLDTPSVMADEENRVALHLIRDYRALISAAPTPPSSPPLDVVREWWKVCSSDDRTMATIMYRGDRMAAALTAQAKRIEGLTEECQVWRDKEGVARGEAIEAECQARDLAAAIGVLQIQVADRAEIVGERDRLNSELALSEVTVTELRAEVERLTGMKLELCKLIGQVRDERDTARAALAKIDAIRNDIIARQTINWSAHIYPLVAALGEAGYEGVDYETARAALPSPTLPPTKGEG